MAAVFSSCRDTGDNRPAPLTHSTACCPRATAAGGRPLADLPLSWPRPCPGTSSRQLQPSSETSPRDDVSGVIVQSAFQLIRPLSDSHQVREVGLPEFMDSACGMPEPLCGRQDDAGWTGDQAVCLQDRVNASFRQIIALDVSDMPGQFPGRFLRKFQGGRHNLLFLLLRDLVPEPSCMRFSGS